MRQTSWSRMRRQAIGAVVLAFCAVPIPALATAAHAQSGCGRTRPLSRPRQTRPYPRQGFNTKALTIKAGRKIVDDVIVMPHAKRVVLIQVRRPGSADFKTLSTGHSSATASSTPSTSRPGLATWRFRLLVRRIPTA